MSPAAQPGGRATKYGDIVRAKWTAEQAELERCLSHSVIFSLLGINGNG
jgi:hypothetical protein